MTMSNKLHALHEAIAKANLSPRQVETVRDLMVGFCSAEVPEETWARYVEESVAFAAKGKPGYDPAVAKYFGKCAVCEADCSGTVVVCQACAVVIAKGPPAPERSGKDAAAGPDL